MSTERPDNDVTGPRRRRPPLAVASVAAAVLLAGSGAAYWASTAAGGGGAADAGRAAPADAVDPPLLALDATDSSPEAPRGIAPGEPDPNGGRVIYRAAGELPDGPDGAAVHRPKGAVTSAEVARLAEALGVAGTPRTEGTAWKVGTDGDGSGPILRVNKQAPGTWTYAKYRPGGSGRCESTAVCTDRAPDGGRPVSEKAARAAAAPVLKAVGQDDASLDARQLMGAVRVVNADPVVGWLPTYGWATGVQVGPDGDVVGGSGHVKGLEKGAVYPVTGADEAIEELNRAGGRSAGGDIGGCATPVPLEDGPTQPKDDCVSGSGTPQTVTVEEAVFGLAPRYVDGEPMLVPSWLFSVRPAAGGPGGTVAQVAVEQRYLAKEGAEPTPAPTKAPGDGESTAAERQITSYSADARTLEVTFWGGVCSTYTASVEEKPDVVLVTVTESKKDGNKACIMIAKELTRTVTLDAPLDGRKVVDAASGSTVPRG